MKKVDFSKIEIVLIDGAMREADFQHGENGLPNQVYMQAREIRWKELGVKMYHAKGEVELTDEEAKYILDFIRRTAWSIVAIEAIERAMKDE